MATDRCQWQPEVLSTAWYSYSSNWVFPLDANTDAAVTTNSQLARKRARVLTLVRRDPESGHWCHHDAVRSHPAVTLEFRFTPRSIH